MALVISAPIATKPPYSQKVIARKLQEECPGDEVGSEGLSPTSLVQLKATPRKATLENIYLGNCDFIVISHFVGIGGKKKQSFVFWAKERAKNAQDNARVLSRVFSRKSFLEPTVFIFAAALMFSAQFLL